MTRRFRTLALLASLGIASAAAAQTSPAPAGPSRYSPRAGAPLGQPAPNQPVQQQPARAFGPQPAGAQPAVRTAQGNPNQQPLRQVADQQPIRPPVGNVGPLPAAPVVPQQPAWFPLEASQHKWVDQILAFWEQESSKVKTFECSFERFDYDPVFGPKDEAKTIAQGVIKYAQPDKGLYRVEKLFSYVGPPKNPGERSQYVEQDATFGEHWVCDGKLIHSFEAQKKQVTVAALPPEMQGKGIVDGPLPFMFGAKAQTIKARYWIRVLPETGNGKFWLEAVPKSRQDVQNFKFIHIILDENTFLPETLFLFAPNFDPQKNPSRTTHIFKNIKTDNEKALKEKLQAGLDPLRLFTSEFYNVKIPRDWKKVVEGDSPVTVDPPLEAKGRPEVPKRPLSALPR